MKKVFQLLVDKDKGDCLRAALCSLLELSLSSIPNFVEEFGDDWFSPFSKIIHANGCEYVRSLRRHAEAEYSTIHKLSEYQGVDGYFIAAVLSPMFWRENGATHAVIIDRNYNIVHDPNPNNAGIKQYPLAEQNGYNGVLYVYIIERAKKEA